MWVLETLFDLLGDWMLQFGPRWMRVGCTWLLVVAVAGMLGLVIYAWIFA